MDSAQQGAFKPAQSIAEHVHTKTLPHLCNAGASADVDVGSAAIRARAHTRRQAATLSSSRTAGQPTQQPGHTYWYRRCTPQRLRYQTIPRPRRTARHQEATAPIRRSLRVHQWLRAATDTSIRTWSNTRPNTIARLPTGSSSFSCSTRHQSNYLPKRTQCRTSTSPAATAIAAPSRSPAPSCRRRLKRKIQSRL